MRLFQDQQPATKETPSIFAVFRDFQALPLFIIEIRVWREKLGSQFLIQGDMIQRLMCGSAKMSAGKDSEEKKYLHIYIYIYTVPVPNAHITRIHLFGPFGQFQWLTMTLDATRGFSTLRWLLGCPFDGSSERSSMCLSQVYSEKKVWNPRRGWKGRWPLHKPAKINWSILRWHDWWRYPKW